MSHRVLLPGDVVPEVYDLSLEPNLQTFTFDGTVIVHCEVKVATDVIQLHSRDLAIHDASFHANGKSWEAQEINLQKKMMIASFRFAEPLPTGKGELKIQFTGTLNNRMAGFYRSGYTSSTGEPAFMAVTQFEPIDARRCFPCWDEPAQKAIFNVTLIVPSKLTALSNMPEQQVEYVSGGRKRVTFLPTPKMSPYLLAFCVAELEYMAKLTQGGVLMRVFSVPGKRAACQYALQCGVQALDFYNSFFGVPFPLPKMDMLAVPDFAAGAMENWGLVTYREVDMLCDLATVSVQRKQRICTVVAHELAHQWFGNLVTMAWWDDLWLNEGFANWMQHFCSNVLAPEWDLWTTYVGEPQQNALRLDSLRSSHPIQVPIMHASEVEEVFDAISYCKGGSLVRMLFSVLGYDHFRAGLQLYFKRHAYGNTETTDLAAAWAEVSGMPVAELLESWTSKMGFPLLRVLKDPFEGGVLEIEQSWFLADGSVQAGDEAVRWIVPLHIGSDGSATTSGPSGVQFLREKTETLPFNTAGASWMKLNFGQHVPCRVLYPSSLSSRLATHLASLPAEDRIGLLSDSYALSKAGLQDPAQLVDLLGGYRGENNDKVWAEVATVVSALGLLTRNGLDENVAVAYQRFASEIVMPKAKTVGWVPRAGESDNDKKMRATVIGLLANLCASDEWVQQEAAQLFSPLVADGSTGEEVAQDIRRAVIAIIVQNDKTFETFEKLQQLHSRSDDDGLKRDIYAALGRAPPTVQERALAWDLTDDVKAQDMVHLPMIVAVSGPAGAELAFRWVRQNFDRLHTRLGTTSMMLFSHFVRISGSGFVTMDKAAEVEAFWRGKDIYAQLKKTVGQTREAIENNAKFVDRLRTSAVASPEFWEKHCQ